MMETVHDLHLRHYSYEPIHAVHDAEPKPDHFKPVGFWVSVEGNDDGWAEWCAAEDFSGKWSHAYDVVLSKDADILWLRAAYSLDDLTEDHGEPSPYSHRRSIDWTRLAGDYDGIVIAPYQWSRRLEGEASKWYYSWDCASGCIWNASAVAELVEQPLEVVA